MRKVSKSPFSRFLRPAWLAVSLSIAVAALSGCTGEDAPPTGQDATAPADRAFPAPADQASPAPADLREHEPPAAIGPEAGVGEMDQPAEGNGAVAIKVNDRVVTKEEFERDLQKQMAHLERQLGDIEIGESPEIAQRLQAIRGQMKEQLVEQTIMRMLVEDYVARSDVEVTDEEVDSEWNEIVAQFPDPDRFEATLQQEGVTVSEAREQVAQQVKLEKLMAQEFSQDGVTDDEAQAFYDLRSEEFAQPAQVRARHILLRDEEGAEEAIQKLHKRIEEGEDFAELAGEFSECPSGKQGGDLGFFGEGQMVEPFSQQAFAMDAGEVSEPIRTEFGHHIIKVEESREAKQAEFAEVQEAIKEHLGQQRAQVQQEEFIKRLREAATITVNVDLPESQPFAFP